jgi:hypothetical protein
LGRVANEFLQRAQIFSAKIVNNSKTTAKIDQGLALL